MAARLETELKKDADYDAIILLGGKANNFTRGCICNTLNSQMCIYLG
jgi:putative intracellular protease/amidase